MKNYSFPICILAQLPLPSCTSTSPNHFLKEADYRNKVEADFGQKKEILNRGNLFFDIFNEDMSLEEREAMMFLYAYMTRAIFPTIPENST